jgi:hypothetical protein
MRTRKYLIGAMLGVIGALVVSAAAFAGSAQRDTLQVTVSPKKQDPKRFGPASLHLIISHLYDNFLGTRGPRQTVFTVPRDFKIPNQGNIPNCSLSQVQNKPTAQARAACPQSIVGGGTVQAGTPGGTLNGVATLFAAGPKTIFVQTDINNGSVILTIIGTASGSTITFSNIPDTPGINLTVFDVTVNKRKVGKNLWYLMVRCSKKKKWATSATTTFYDGKVLSASASQKCKQK